MSCWKLLQEHTHGDVPWVCSAKADAGWESSGTYCQSQDTASFISTSLQDLETSARSCYSGNLCSTSLQWQCAQTPQWHLQAEWLGRIRAHQRVTDLMAEISFSFILSGAGIQVGQACSMLSNSLVSPGIAFMSIKADLAVESFSTSLINTSSSRHSRSALCWTGYPSHHTSSALLSLKHSDSASGWQLGI